MGEELLTLDEVADSLRLKPLTIYRWAEDGKIRGIQTGKNWRFRQSELNRFLSEQESRKYYERGRKYLELGDETRAVYELKEATKIYPVFIEAHFFLADIYFRKGEKEKNYVEVGIERLKKILEIDPENIPARTKLSQILKSKEQLSETLSSNPQVSQGMALLPSLISKEKAWEAHLFEHLRHIAHSLSTLIASRDAYGQSQPEKSAV